MEWWDKAFKTGFYPLGALAQTPGWKQRTKMETAFALRVLNPPRGASLLDVCCGTGRHAVEMARRCRVTGIDISPFYLKEAALGAKKRGVAVKLLKRDAREMGFKEEFESAVNLFTSFGYFSKASDDLRMLKSIHAALKPGGRFLLDTYNGTRLLLKSPGQTWSQSTDLGKGLMLSEEGAMRGNIAYTHWTVSDSGRIHEIHSRIRMHTLLELKNLIKKAGFKILKTFGEMNGSPYKARSSSRLIILAEKPLK